MPTRRRRRVRAGEGDHDRDWLDVLSKIAGAFALILTPVAVASLGAWASLAIKRSETAQEMLKIASDILRSEPTATEKDKALRGWAVSVLAEHAPASFSEQARAALIENRLPREASTSDAILPPRNDLQACGHHMGPVLTRDAGLKEGDRLICGPGFAVAWRTDERVPRWTAELLTAENLTKPRHPAAQRSFLTFAPDPRLLDETDGEDEGSDPGDYRQSGFDRGHLASASNMAWSGEAYRDANLMSNIAPQHQRLNRSVMAKLEDAIRETALKRGRLYVLTGTVFQEVPPQKLKGGRIGVPTHFYKVIFDEKQGAAYAFLLENAAPTEAKDYRAYRTTIGAIEAMTGIDFFSTLSARDQTRLQATLPPFP